MPAHPLAGDFSVDASAKRIRHYRYAEERLTRIMSGWIALTPELPVKLLFGRHVWDCAQHADLWGRRLPELRAPAQQSEPSGPGFVEFLDLLETAEGPAQSLERVVGVYRVAKPHLLAVYERHLAEANAIYEPPTRRILTRCIGEERRHVVAGRIVLDHLFGDGPDRQRALAWESRLLGVLARAGGVTGGERDVLRAGLTDDVPVDSDVVALESHFDPSRLDPELQRALVAHAHAIRNGDWAAAAGAVDGDRRGVVLDVYRALGAVARADVAAAAQIGGYRFVKIVFSGGAGVTVVQQQWRRQPDGWRVVDAAVVRTAPAS